MLPYDFEVEEISSKDILNSCPKEDGTGVIKYRNEFLYNIGVLLILASIVVLFSL